MAGLGLRVSKERTYLDWNATAPLLPAAREAMLAAADGNPSSVHAEGRAARRLIEIAREAVAALAGAAAINVIFTSGGTEANALALSPELGSRLLVSAVEHASVLAGGGFARDAVDTLRVSSTGVIDLADLERRLRDVSRPVVSLMVANNETGVIQPVSEAAAIVHAAGGMLIADAVQAAGRVPLDIAVLGADIITLSAHKLGGPKGIGAMIRRDASIPLQAMIRGGGQERGLRAGTENVSGIAGFGAAASASRDGFTNEAPRLQALRDDLETQLRDAAPDAIIFGEDVPRLPNTTLFAVPGIKAETAVIALDLAGIAVSAGSACSSGKVAPSHVLAAMGAGAGLAAGGIRVSLGRGTTQVDVDRFVQAWNSALQSLRRSGPRRPGRLAA